MRLHTLFFYAVFLFIHPADAGCLSTYKLLVFKEMKLVKFEGKDTDFVIPAYATAEWKKNNPEKIMRILALDNETTGLSHEKDTVIEFAGRLIEINQETGELIGVGESYDGFQDPGMPLSPEVEKLTGISYAQLKGQSIEWNRVRRMMEQSDVVLAHNAQFDRPFLEKNLELAKQKKWVCSYALLNWRGKGFPNSKLETLSHAHGFYVDAHRAIEDVNAMVHLLSMRDRRTQIPYLKELVDSSKGPVVKFEAVGAPYAKKDILKANGYIWKQPLWIKYVPEKLQAEEKSWLEKNVYEGVSQAVTHAYQPTELFR